MMRVRHRRAGRLVLQLTPALVVVTGLFGAGLVGAALQGLGLMGVGGSAGPTLAHYAAVANDEEFRASLGLTMWVASVSTAVSTAGGVTVALLLIRLRGARTLVYGFLQTPLAVPHLAMAIGVLVLLAPSGWIARLFASMGAIDAPSAFPALIYDRWGAGIILAYVAKETPFIAIVTTALLLRLGPEYDRVAQTLGASPWQRLRHVTLPLVAPGVTAAALMAFAYVFAAFETPFLLGRPYPAMLSVVAQRRYMSLELGDRPGAVAFALVMTVVAGLAVWSYLRLSHAAVGRERPVVF